MRTKRLYILCSGNPQMNVDINSLLFGYIYQKIKYVSFVYVGGGRLNKDSVLKVKVNGNEYLVVQPQSIVKLYSLLDADSVVISLLSHRPKDWKVFFVLRLLNIPVIYINNLSTQVRFDASLTRINDNNINFFKKIVGGVKVYVNTVLLARMYVLLTKINILQKIDTVYISNKQDAKNYAKKKNYSRVITINSKAFDDVIVNGCSDEKYIVFIDSMLPYHGDQIAFGYIPIDRKRYYASLNKLLDRFSVLMNKDIIVCLHPKYNISNAERDFPGRIACVNKTDFYIRNAALVLFHESSAVTSAVACKKNVIQITSGLFNEFVKENCISWSKELPIRRIDLLENDDEIIAKLVYSNADGQIALIEEYISENIASSGDCKKPGFKQVVHDMIEYYQLP